MFQTDFVCRQSTQCLVLNYSVRIQKVVKHLNLLSENTFVSHEVSSNSTVYKKDLFVFIGEQDDNLIVGCINCMLLHKGVHLYLPVQLHDYHIDSDLSCSIDLSLHSELTPCVSQ